MPQLQTPTKPIPENLDAELLRRLEAYVRSERNGPRVAGLHTSDLVSSTVLKLLVRTKSQGKTLEYEDFRKLAYRIAHGVVVDAVRAISRAARRARSLELVPPTEAATVPTNLAGRLEEGALQAAVRELEHDDHRLVVMRLWGTNWEQIASSLGITDEAARKRWQRLLAELRLKLPD